MVFGTVGRRLTEIWNRMFIGITSCEQKHREGNVAEDVYIACVCRVGGVGEEFFDLLAGVTGCCCVTVLLL
jgi:hypothetical protein